MLKLIAPFRALFSLDSSAIAANPGKFTYFLKLTSKELENPQSSLRKNIHPSLDIDVNIPVETSDSEIGSRYISLNANGSLYLSPRIFTIRFKPSETNDIEGIYNKSALMADEVTAKYSKNFYPDISSFRIDIHDNTIATLSMEMIVDRNNLNKNDYAWNKLDEWTTVLIHFLLSEIYQIYIYPVLEVIRKFSQESEYKFVQNVSEYSVFPDLVGDTENPHTDLKQRFMLMWVNRTLCYKNDYAENNWIKPLIRKHDILNVKGAEVHLNSGNSIIIMPQDMDKRNLAQLWDVILSTQYYYAAMDVVNINLIRYIGTTFTKVTSDKLRILSKNMEAIVNKVTILQVHYNDFSMELQGTAQKIFHLLQKEWNFNILTHNVQKKIELCKSNITVLNQETNQRNQGRMQIVLTGLAGMGILNIFVELGTYATQMPDAHLHMVGQIPGFMDLGFILSGNALSWIGIFIAVSIVIFSIKNRFW